MTRRSLFALLWTVPAAVLTWRPRYTEVRVGIHPEALRVRGLSLAEFESLEIARFGAHGWEPSPDHDGWVFHPVSDDEIVGYFRRRV